MIRTLTETIQYEKDYIKFEDIIHVSFDDKYNTISIKDDTGNFINISQKSISKLIEMLEEFKIKGK